MNRRRQIIAPRQGFTLLEVLLAVAVFAVVLAAINAVFFGALRLRNRTAETFERALPIDQTVAIIRRDLQNLVPPGGTLVGPLQTTPTTNTSLALPGTRVSPDFFTVTGQLDEQTPFSEMQRVCFYLQPSTNQTPGFDLVRMVTRNLLPVAEEPPEAQVLLGGVQQVLMQYFDGSAWQDQWDTTVSSNLPVAIRMEIQMYSEDGRAQAQQPPLEILARVMTDMLTNQIATATNSTAGGGQ